MRPLTRIARLASMTDQLVSQLQGLHFMGTQSGGTGWVPAVNVYAYDDRLEVCVDLAGMRKQEITVEVLDRRLLVRGYRAMPDSDAPERAKPETGGCRRVLVMEIADGGFERVIEFPTAIDAGRVSARQDNGWLWITLPKLSQEKRS